RTAPAPAAAREILEKLIDNLPQRMRPRSYSYSLTVIEQSDAEACALGAGYIYVSRDLLKISLGDPRSGPEQLAFALADQLGHLSLGHARRIYQRLWLNEHVRSDVEAKRKLRIRLREPDRDQGNEPLSPEEEGERIRMTMENLAGVGAMLEHVYSRQDQFEADLFAIHLCRNAGFDVEKCLDGLRRQAVATDAGLLQEHPPRGGIP